MVVPEHVFSAAVNGRMDVLREYFASGDRDPNETLERNGWTLLEGACAGKREVEVISPPGYPVQTRAQHVIKCEAVSFLLSQGASVNFQSRSGLPAARSGGTAVMGTTAGTTLAGLARTSTHPRRVTH